MNKETALVIFKEKTIRRVWHQEEWWFSVVDVSSPRWENAHKVLLDRVNTFAE